VSSEALAPFTRQGLGVQIGEVDDEDNEPPVPAGLGALDEPLRALVDFFGLDADLVAVAAEREAEAAKRRKLRLQLMFSGCR
jgi:hypothetical protein